MVEGQERRLNMNRRDFLGRATVVGAAGLTVIGAMTGAHAVLAQPAMVGVTRGIENFEKRIDLIRQSLDIPGMSVAVLRKQEVILARGFGIVDIAKGTPATEHTPYPIASLTKTFAAAVIMRLVASGRLDLDEAMSSYDPGYGQWCAELKSHSLA
jgi:CubicO group peptidase (beta-lactamase class C family)